MSEILRVAQCYEADRLSESHGVTVSELMQNAGKKIADAIKIKFSNNKKILVICGSGNNGGDGFITAKYLKKEGFDVKVQVLSEKQSSDISQDARNEFEKTCKHPEFKREIVDFEDRGFIEWADIIIDGIFGAGLDRDIEEPIFSLIDYVNEARESGKFGLKEVVAIDLPSGINGDSGKIMLKAIEVDYTYTFFRKKPAHLLLPGKEYCGKVQVLDIGIPSKVLQENKNINIYENNPLLWKDKLRHNQITDNKYIRGFVSISSGNMHGATIMAAMAARRTGAGFVEILSTTRMHDIFAAHCVGEVIRNVDNRAKFNTLLENPERSTFLIGCGAGVNVVTRERVLAILASRKSVIIDADAINVFREKPQDLFNAIQKHKDIGGECLLTPHLGEFKRIFEFDESDKLGSIMRASKLSGSDILLKGNDTIITSALRNKIVINSNADANLATAGTGDVLAGIIAALISQGTPVFESACAGVWIQGKCSREIGYGLIAEDIPDVIPCVMEELF